MLAMLGGEEVELGALAEGVVVALAASVAACDAFGRTVKWLQAPFTYGGFGAGPGAWWGFSTTPTEACKAFVGRRVLAIARFFGAAEKAFGMVVPDGVVDQ
jgi:hypothetical protein